VALGFYRVRVPCYIRMSEYEKGSERNTTFYFTPEYDFMHISMCGPVEHTFADFIHDLKAYDPRDVGLLHLVMDYNALNSLHCLTNISEDIAKSAFVDSLSQL
jgi:hypothetical protein